MEMAVWRQLSTYNIIDFGVKPFKKGLVGVERAKPSACILCRFSPFFTVSEMFLSTSFRAAEPKILSKKKKLPYRECFKGALSLAERPSLAKQSPGLFRNSHPAERTACKGFAHCDERQRALPSGHPQALY